MARKFTEEQLNKIDHEILVSLFLQQAEQIEKLTSDIQSLTDELRKSNDTNQKIMEQLILAKDNRFGRSSEKMDDLDQISFSIVGQFSRQNSNDFIMN